MTIWPYHPTRVLLLAVSTNPREKETITIYLLFQVPGIWFPGRAKDYAIQEVSSTRKILFFWNR